MIFSVLSFSAVAQKGTAADPYVLSPSPQTVAWGYYWSEAKPVLHVRSGDYVNVHTLLTSTPERLEGAGVPADQVEKELRDVQAVKDRGPGGMFSRAPFILKKLNREMYLRYDLFLLTLPYLMDIMP